MFSCHMLLILSVVDSLVLATPRSKRVLMHACMAAYAMYSLVGRLFVFCDAQE